MQQIKIQSKPPIHIKSLFQLSIGLKMFDSGQNWLDTMFFKMSFELTISLPFPGTLWAPDPLLYWTDMKTIRVLWPFNPKTLE
jgi:hypothetical protein